MQFTYNKKRVEKPLNSFFEEKTFKLPKKSGDENYASPFNLLKNWALIRCFADNNYKLISDYIHLLEQ